LIFIALAAGLSSSLLDQVKQILEVVGTALYSVSSGRRKEALQSHESATRAEEEVRDTVRIQERIRRGVWHDPRLGAIAGGGIIAELGVGDEPFREHDEDLVSHTDETNVSSFPKARREDKGSPDHQATSVLPIVVLKNYTAGGKEELMDVFAKWAAALIEGQVRRPLQFNCEEPPR
jgi:RNA12 protein